MFNASCLLKLKGVDISGITGIDLGHVQPSISDLISSLRMVILKEIDKLFGNMEI